MDRGRFSFMGAQGGPLWRAITYHLPPPASSQPPHNTTPPAPPSTQHTTSPGTPQHPPGATSVAGLLPLLDMHVSHAAAGPGTGTVYVQDGSGRVASCQIPFFQFLRQLLDTHQLEVTPEAAQQLPFNFWGGLVGYLGYELKAECGGQRTHAARTPDAGLMFADRLLAVDHLTGDVFLLAVFDQRMPQKVQTDEQTSRSAQEGLTQEQGADASNMLSRLEDQGKAAAATRSNGRGQRGRPDIHGSGAAAAAAWLDEMEQRVLQLCGSQGTEEKHQAAARHPGCVSGHADRTGVPCVCGNGQDMHSNKLHGGADQIASGTRTANGAKLTTVGLQASNGADHIVRSGQTTTAGHNPSKPPSDDKSSTTAQAVQSAQSLDTGCQSPGGLSGAPVQSAISNGCAAAANRGEAVPSPSRTLRLRHPKQRYMENIAACISALHSGESYEVCLTTALLRRGSPPPHTLYKALRSLNPAPYGAWLNLGSAGPTICCSSPERFLRGDRGCVLEARPIKGTAARHASNPRADRAAAQALAASEKDRAENLMIVDLLRNDLGAVCEVGSVHVPGLMEIESYATVHQMVSTVRGLRRRDASLVDALQAAFPAGSMTGAPKVRTMAIIDSLEGAARGVYSGSVGFISLNDCFDLNVVIRTAVIDTGARLSHTTPTAAVHRQATVAKADAGFMAAPSVPGVDAQDPVLLPGDLTSGTDLTGQDDLDTSVATVQGLDQAVVSIGAGGAIVVQSELEGEFAEMRLKARALLAALGQCDGEDGPALLDDAQAWAG